MRKLFRERSLHEPLLHFLVLGAILFVAFSFLNREPEADPQRIVVGPGQIEHMITMFARTWQRAPTPDEVKGLIDEYVREEVLSREAVKLGLDQNDVIIRRRLQQKMEFIAADLAALAEPTDADLAGYLAAHPDAFRQDEQLTFRQVYLNPEKHDEQLDDVAARLLADLQARGAQADVAAFGDPTLLQAEFRDEPQGGVEAAFGSEFAAELGRLPVGEWSGPVASGYGLHLVFLEQRTEGRVPTLDEVRAQVQRDWESAKREEANGKFLEELLKQYEVSVDWEHLETEGAAAR